jgi:AraC-like DNA-binding protein
MPFEETAFVAAIQSTRTEQKWSNLSVKKLGSRDHELPTIDVQAFYSGSHRNVGGASPCAAHLTKLTTQQPLQFEASGQKHNFNFQISQAIRTEWKSGMHRGVDVVAPGHVSLNAAQENFSCSVAPVSKAVSLHVEISTDWIKEIRESEAKRAGMSSGELTPMIAIWHKRLSDLSTRLSIALSRTACSNALQVEQLLLEIAVELICRSEPNAIELMPRGKLSCSSLNRVLDYLHDQLHAPHSLKELAAVADYSPFHFARLFKTTVGVSPHRYLTQLRIQRSQFLLTHGSLPITAIASELGFDSSSHFTSTFRQITGVTPTLFRASCT